MKFQSVLVFCATALLAALANANPTKIACPQTLDVAESASTDDSSWAIAKDHGKLGYVLDSVAISSGHPDGMGSLEPAVNVTGPRLRKLTWDLPSPSVGEEYWATCSYTNTLAVLTKALPVYYKKCVLNEAKSGADYRTNDFWCE